MLQSTIEDRTFDGDGVMRSVTITNPAGTAKTWSMTWDPTRPNGEVLSWQSAGQRTSFLYGNERAASMNATGLQSYEYNPLGDIVAGRAGTVESTGYAPFGKGETLNATVEPRFGYRGEIQIGNRVHLRARDLNTTTARFDRKDPLAGIPGETVETNQYHYANNDPIGQTDPTGLQPTDDTFAPPLPKCTDGICVAGLVVTQAPAMKVAVVRDLDSCSGCSYTGAVGGYTTNGFLPPTPWNASGFGPEAVKQAIAMGVDPRFAFGVFVQESTGRPKQSPEANSIPFVDQTYGPTNIDRDVLADALAANTNDYVWKTLGLRLSDNTGSADLAAGILIGRIVQGGKRGATTAALATSLILSQRQAEIESLIVGSGISLISPSDVVSGNGTYYVYESALLGAAYNAQAGRSVAERSNLRSDVLKALLRGQDNLTPAVKNQTKNGSGYTNSYTNRMIAARRVVG